MLFHTSSWHKSRAIAFAVFFLPALLYFGIQIKKDQNNPVVAQLQVKAQVKNAEKRGQDDYTHYLTSLELKSGDIVQLKLAASPQPKIGDTLPLTLWVRKDGRKEYKLNRAEWEHGL